MKFRSQSSRSQVLRVQVQPKTCLSLESSTTFEVSRVRRFQHRGTIVNRLQILLMSTYRPVYSVAICLRCGRKLLLVI